MPLTRDELEREIVVWDKQKLITYCLKLFDSSERVVAELESLRLKADDMDQMVRSLKVENDRLKRQSIWQFINTKLARAIERKKKRNAIYKR